MHYSLCVIGSCRVYTPMSKVDNKNLSVAHGETEWFTHSSKDVIQKIIILNRLLELDDSIINLVVNNISQYNESYHKPGFFDDVDLFVIEISSLQSNFYKGFELQQWCVRNYIKNPEAFTNTSSGMNLDIVTRTLNEFEVSMDLRTIYQLLGRKPILFVSHNLLPMPNGKPHPSRVKILETLTAFSENFDNVSVFDPTPLILDYGIDFAMKDSTHYSKEFEPIIGEAIVNKLLNIFGAS